MRLRTALPLITLVASFVPPARAEVLVDLDATSLPSGPLVTWTNQGSVEGDFTREFDTPSVATISGVNGVTLDGNNDWYVGPTAPAAVTGNGSRTIYAWVWNPSHGVEETVFSWSRRGGPAGTHTALNHGSHPTWGAVAHWDAPDIGWNGTQEAGIWTCLAYTYDNATGLVSVYTNGRLANSETIAPLNVKTGAPFVVGCENSSGGSRDNNQFPGSMTIAKVKVHDEALDPAQVAEAYNADAAIFGRPLAPVPVTIGAFTLGTEAIYRGDSTTLDWSVSGAETLTISPAVATPEGADSAAVSPLQTTTYTLTATGPGGTQTATVTLHVEPGVPVAEDQSAITPRDTAKALTLVVEDPNPPPGGFTWTIVAPPANGTLTGTAPDLTYTPDNGFSGTDSFTFKANDGHADSNTATVSLAVDPPAAAPTDIVASETKIDPVAAGGSFVANLSAVDPNFGETHSYELVSGIGATHNALFEIAGHQVIASDGFTPNPATTYSIRVRTTDSTGRSVGRVLTFTVGDPAPPVVITELFYDPPGNARTEFIELHNTGGEPVSIAGWQITRGVDHTFPPGATIPAGGYAVVAMDPAAFLTEFGFAAHGPWEGRLSGEGETVELADDSGAVIDTVSYKSEFPWPISPGSDGASMELIHPALDNDLGGSWRGSETSGLTPLTYVAPADTGWIYKPGTAFPAANWRTAAYSPDGSWIAAQAPIGFGTVNGLPLNTVVGGMQGSYHSIFARKTFSIAPGEVPSALKVRYSADDGIIMWINGTEVARRNVGGSSPDPSLSTAADNFGSEGLWYDLVLTNATGLLTEGTNVVAVRVFNQSLNSSDLGLDIELERPAGESLRLPTPAAENSVHAAVAPPQIRQVNHSPKQPESGEAAVITAKVTDPQGVDAVQLHYQIVSPGGFIPARFPRTAAQILADPKGERPVNPAFEDSANWTTATMADDGSGGDAAAADGIFTVVLPARPHRTLVRYRITITDLGGASVRVPYGDDGSLNFAYFVYDGVPDFTAAAASVHPSGAGKVWPKALLDSLPVYHWIIREQDMAALQAYEGFQQMPNTGDDTVLAARRTEDWEGAFVYDGVVYDHVVTRLRGGNSRYGDFEGRFPRGKRHYKFQFNGGHHFQAKDEKGNPYPTKWQSLAVNKMFGNKGGNGWGMPEEIGARLWSSFGVPAAETHWFHFRVIDGAAEAPDQYNGDFWGIQQIVEEYEGTFLDARGIEKGNLYKMSDWIWDAERQRRYQSPDMVRDGSEFNTIRDHLHGGQNQAWLLEKVDYDSWYRYSAVAEAIRHYDLFPYTDDIRHSLKNLAWHFAPAGPDPTRGRVTFLPYDWDASFGPNWNNGWEHANNALYGWDMTTSDGMPYLNKPAMKLEHRNVLREFRDLVWQPDQLLGLIDDRAAVIAEFSKADQDRWRGAPQSAGTATDDPLPYKLQDMKNFCFTGWSGSTGPTVGPGGRAAYLDGLADNADGGLLPQKPVIAYTGGEGHPLDGLSFSCSAFSDPQGAGTFGGMAWRIGEIEDPSAPAYDPERDYFLEIDAIWESGELPAYQSQVSIPSSALKLGRTYRARVKMKDNTGRWSHWSDPYQFTTAAPTGIDDLQQFLMITEIMYHPAGPAYPGSTDQEFEYLELMNISDSVVLDLADVRFHKGIDFDFADGNIPLLFPGERVLVVKNRAAFESRYGTGLPIAGEWESGDSLSNGGEQLALGFGADTDIHDFVYADAAPWPTEPDGGGPSLMLVDPYSAPDHGLASSWTAGSVPGGSPGFADGPFAAWMRAQDSNDPEAEFVSGMSHAMAYALGADLMANPQAALPAASFTAGAEDEMHLTLSYRRRLGAGDADYQVETGTDLDTWRSGPGVVEQIGVPVPNGDGTETVQVRVITPASEDPARFIRLRITVAD